MRVLETIRGPEDLADLGLAELETLATEIRDFLVPAVCRTGGHLGPNLGVVELTLALHRVFRSPQDRIVWDTGHQSYVHKMLTGRTGDFATLRQPDGLSGYPSRAESPHDLVENSHASTSLAYADGFAKAAALRGEDRQVVAVIGDGGLTGGMAWEALNAIAGAKRNVTIVVNDNGRSYAPTVGGLQEHLASLRVSDGYEQAQDQLRALLEHAPRGQQVYDTLRSMKRGLKELLSPQPLFEDLGLKYLGPVDGHDLQAMERALVKARNFSGPVIVHAITQKGMGYKPAEEDDDDCLHGVGQVDPVSGRPTAAPSTGWTDVVSSELVAIADGREDVVGVTAAMLIPVGLKPFAEAYPDRVFDVGIAEQHAVTSAAGLAMGGMHPVVCLYATFLNRAFDQTLMDVGLHRLPVTFCLDRAGVTGTDGPSHHGMWDLSILALVPGMAIAAPRDGARLREALQEAVAIDDGPSALRYPKGSVGEDVPALRRTGTVDVLREGRDVLLVAVGPLAGAALGAAQLCAEEGITVTVVDPRWVKPVDPALVELAARHRIVVTVEDGGRHGGAGSLVAEAVADAGLDVRVRVLGLAQEYLEQGSRGALLEVAGLAARPIARTIIEAVAASSATPRVQDRLAG